MQTSENDRVFDAVADFVSGQTGHPRSRITPATTLFGDLGVDGDDGTEFVEEFAHRFNVDMTGYRPVHFGPEGLPLWAPLCWLWLGLTALLDRESTPESRAGITPISMADLVDSARLRRWTLQYGE